MRPARRGKVRLMRYTLRARLVLVLFAAGILFAAPTRALAQTEGSIAGVVVDQSGAAVPGATVVVTNDRTGVTRETTTTAEGAFQVDRLSPSTYTIRVTLDGFAPLEYPNVPVAVAQNLNFDFRLSPAGVTEAVTVSATTTVVDLSSARIGANVGEREVAGLPVNGRQMSQLMLQAPEGGAE